MRATSNTEVLIIGAGPTGLALALWLAKSGIRVRIIDKNSAPGTTSRAMAVQARILEFYEQLGIAKDTISRGLILKTFQFWVRGKKIATAPFGDFGKGMSPYPFMLIFPQDEHERMLIEYLKQNGVEVERSTELVDYIEGAGGIQARIKKSDGSIESCFAAYICGCDGAHSAMREQIHAGFPGGTYEQIFFVADVEATGPSATGQMNLCLDDTDISLVFPLKNNNHVRLIGLVPPHVKKTVQDMNYQDVAKEVARVTQLTVRDIYWFSAYHVHYRVAARFRKGRAFLLGDAAHIHSPAGGQGMNTGIGDAVNLAWKLTMVLRGRADERLLESYETERQAFAKRLVATTDRFFRQVANTGWWGNMVRIWIQPSLVPVLMNLNVFRRFAFRTISQLIIQYHHSALSVGRAGKIQAGDRLPWVEAVDNFIPLLSRDWQVHIHGEANAALTQWCESHQLSLHVMPWKDEAKRKGYVKNALYLVRPDGYVALADQTASAEALAQYFAKRGLR